MSIEASVESGSAAVSYTIQGRRVGFPVCVRDASSGSATFLVSASAARKLLPTDAVEVAELLPGRALLSLAVIDYRDNDLGDYNEISLAFFVRPRSQGRGIPYLGTLRDFFAQNLGTYIWRLPVNQGFTCEAGRQIWGFPKTVDEIELEKTSDRCICTWTKDGQRVLRLSLPRGGARSMPERPMTTYTMMEGVAHATEFTSGAEGVGIRMGGARLELGAHPIADELSSLGLPRSSLLSTWMEHMHGRFEPARKL